MPLSLVLLYDFRVDIKNVNRTIYYLNIKRTRGVFRRGPNRHLPPPLNSANIRRNADCLA